MSHSGESGGYQGAISSMVAVVDVCPSCGKLAAEHRRGFPFSSMKPCPETAVGAFPFIPADADPLAIPDETLSPRSGTASDRYPAAPEETAAGVFASPFPAGRPSRRADLLTMTWNLARGAEDFP